MQHAANLSILFLSCLRLPCSQTAPRTAYHTSYSCHFCTVSGSLAMCLLLPLPLPAFSLDGEPCMPRHYNPMTFCVSFPLPVPSCILLQCGNTGGWEQWLLLFYTNMCVCSDLCILTLYCYSAAYAYLFRSGFTCGGWCSALALPDCAQAGLPKHTFPSCVRLCM